MSLLLWPRLPRVRTLAGGVVLLAALLWLLDGRVGLLLALAIAAYDLLRSPASRELLGLSLALLCLVPVAVFVSGLLSNATLGPDFAAGPPAALRTEPSRERALVLRRPSGELEPSSSGSPRRAVDSQRSSLAEARGAARW